MKWFTILLLTSMSGLLVHAKDTPPTNDTSATASQDYDDYVKNISWKHDDAIQVPKGVKIAPSRKIDMSKSPFKREVKRLKIVQKKLHNARKKMEKKFQTSGTWSKETAWHENLRTQEKIAKKQIVRRYNLLLGSEVPKIEKINFQVRGLVKKIAKAQGKEKAKLKAVHDKYIAEAQMIIQRWVDNVFVYYEFPTQDTWDNTLYPSRNRTFYTSINRAVQKAIKKGGFAVAEEEKEDEEEETGSDYTKKYTELSPDFLSQHFDVSVSGEFKL